MADNKAEIEASRAFLAAKMQHFLKMTVLALVILICICACDRVGKPLELQKTNVISRASVPEEGAFVELSQGGCWLSFRHTNNPSGWGCRLAEPQQSVFVTNGLVVTLPDCRAYDLTYANPRNLIRRINPQNVIWGEATDGLAVGLKVDSGNVMVDYTVQLEAYLRNTSGQPLRVFARPSDPRSLQLKLHVVGPDGKIIKGLKGRQPVQICVDLATASDWPILQPGETLGPLHLTMFTGNPMFASNNPSTLIEAFFHFWYRTVTVFDLWFDCSRRGNYQVSLEYPPDGFKPPEGIAQNWNGSPSVWQGSASSGTVILSKP